MDSQKVKYANEWCWSLGDQIGTCKRDCESSNNHDTDRTEPSEEVVQKICEARDFIANEYLPDKCVPKNVASKVG